MVSNIDRDIIHSLFIYSVWIYSTWNYFTRAF